MEMENGRNWRDTKAEDIMIQDKRGERRGRGVMKGRREEEHGRHL